jgi:REP element-mobilizing transposase RayT
MASIKNKKQIDMFKKGANAYGGELRNRRKGRGQRAISTKHSMHLVLRSSLAKGVWNLRRHDNKIKNTTKKYTDKYGVRLISLANVGNHLHMQIQLTNRHTYAPFIKALTSALAVAVTGANYKSSIRSRANKLGIVDTRRFRRRPESTTKHKKETTLGRKTEAETNVSKETPLRFWDYRPFTRIVHGRQAFLTLRDYIQINRFEGHGYDRGEARFLIFVKKQTNGLNNINQAGDTQCNII